MTVSTRIVLAAAVLLFRVSAADASPIVYSQLPTFPPATLSSLTSEYDDSTGLLPFQTFDNFLLASATQIDGLTWQGIYINVTTGGGPGVRDATSFEVKFYADAGGAPGGLLQTTTLAIGSVGETLVGSDTYFGNASPVFNYSASIPVFSAAAGTPYWLSVIAHTPTFLPGNLWAWTNDDATNGNNATYQGVLGGPPALVGAAPQDRAFSLTGVPPLTAVPEPASLLLVGGGLVGLARRARKHARR